MEYLQFILDKIRHLYQNNPRALKIACVFIVLYIVNKLYQKWKYSQKLFNSPNETNNKVILITGCDTGFGNAVALKLSTKYGYRVIATCLKQESVDKFLSNSLYTANKSTAAVLDVTNTNNIESVKQYTIKYLTETNSTLWGIVNNAGFFIPGPFELIPIEMDRLERNVLLTAPMDITRTFLPLLEGRKNYKTIQDTKTTNNGGRIVNIASIAAHLICNTRYGTSKAALTYFSHSLRMELSPRFGIWVSCIEPGPFGTGIWKQGHLWTKKIIKKLEENDKMELVDIYEYKVDDYEKELDNISDALMSKGPNVEMVIDCIIHGLIAKYPKRAYRPGWNGLFGIIPYGPYWLMEYFMKNNSLN